MFKMKEWPSCGGNVFIVCIWQEAANPLERGGCLTEMFGLNEREQRVHSSDNFGKDA